MQAPAQPVPYSPSQFVQHALTHLPQEDDTLDWAGTIHAAGTHANRPAASKQNKGTLYYETDTGSLFRSDGSTWTQVGQGAGGDISAGGVIELAETNCEPTVDETVHAGYSAVVTVLPYQLDSGRILTIAAGGSLSLDEGGAAPSPLGTLGYAQVTGDQLAMGAFTDLTGLGVTVTVGAGRRIRITGFWNAIKHTADWVQASVREGGTTLAFSQLTIPDAAQAYFIVTAVLKPSAGSHTYQLQTNPNTGTVDLKAQAAAPCYIHVEDIGT